MRKKFKSGPAWLVIIGFATGYEIVAKRYDLELLTHGFNRLWQHWYGKIIIVFITGSLNKHFIFPTVLPKVDPFLHIGKSIPAKSSFDCQIMDG